MFGARRDTLCMGCAVSESVRVFVNGAPLAVPPGSTALDAVRAWKPAEADAVVAGERLIADSRGLPTDAARPLEAGAILRTMSRRDAASDDPGDSAPA